MTHFAVSSLVLSLAWFAAVNVAASVCARGLARLVLGTRLASRPGLLLALRLMPSAAAVVFVAALFFPAHWRFEPGDAAESFGIVLWALASAGAALLAGSAWRLARAAHAGWRLRACEGLPTFGAGASGERVYEVEGLHGLSLAGVLRPRILVGRAVRQRLTAPELDVAIAHERAHQRALDNLKRLAIYAAPDYFGRSSSGRALEAQWRAATEWHADAHAVAGERTKALALASALVKVARLAGERFGATASTPAWSALHEAALLDTRVRRLVAADLPHACAPGRARSGLATLAVIAAAAGALLSPEIHQLTELLVELLP